MPVSTVEWLFPDGDGGARVEHGVVRLAGVVPGDVVRWRPDGKRGGAVVGAVEAIERSSEDRVTPPCPWDAACGGCDLSALASSGRHAALGRVAARAFDRDDAVPFVASPRSTGHRARIKLAIEASAAGPARVGYRAARSHDLVAIEACGVARPEVQEALVRLRAFAASEGAAAALAGLESVEIRSDGARAVFAFAVGARRSGSVDRKPLAALGDVAVDGAVVSGDPTITLAGGPSGPAGAPIRLRASPRSFYQVNLEVNALLVAEVAAAVAALSPERVLDLYAGIGNLTLPVAALGVPVAAVEREGQATADLRFNDKVAAPNRSKRAAVEVIEADVERFDASRVAFDVVVLDPPRAGAPGVLDRVVRQRPKGIVYVACDAVNAARDMRPLLKQGYTLRSLRCFDMFPDTRHFETLAVLTRK